jgi:hypothetical protein
LFFFKETTDVRRKLREGLLFPQRCERSVHRMRDNVGEVDPAVAAVKLSDDDAFRPAADAVQNGKTAFRKRVPDSLEFVRFSSGIQSEARDEFVLILREEVEEEASARGDEIVRVIHRREHRNDARVVGDERGRQDPCGDLAVDAVAVARRHHIQFVIREGKNGSRGRGSSFFHRFSGGIF